ncbi:sugar ABC transporter ATP-binding protein [Lederbergia citrea]|uniref:Sugar ABC transporter ATP-binding protein n=1 Tax=Lederbergia citrea TaxID=2833581 RepID=A0A942USS2_9BACI|nr:sugar ABC transporter ATP-binding protein [Lederbergia citrea]MBS4223324.1 sugar ABC transporter ATP-binding protein [Lederbergia citrea]
MENQTGSIVKFLNISKVFPGVKALDEVSFEIKKGEVHALLGENGAGKSTLLNILHGVNNEYEGIVEIHGKVVAYKNANEAILDGISKVHQEVSLIPDLTVGQNITLGCEPKKGLFIDYNKLHKEANKILKRMNCNFKSEDIARTLSTGEMQMIAIAKGLYHNAQLISFDEPTAALSNQEVNTLFSIINDLKRNGITILYVSHRLDEVFQICDRATVLRDGKHVDTFNINDVTREQLIKKMVGRDVSAYAVRKKKYPISNESVLKVENLSVNGVFESINFHLRKGEILGFAGLVGSKRTDVVRTIFGATRKTTGTIKINEKIVDIKSPEQAVKLGIGLIPEDRKTQGFIKYFDNANNVGLTKMEKFMKFGLLNHKSKTKNCNYYAEEINLRPKDPFYMTNNLSGGNQQKVVIAKWLSSDTDILILDEPTKGVDVGAKAEIYRVLEELIGMGKSIIVVSSELPEVLGLSDRIIVMREGRQVKEFINNNLTEEDILQYAMGVGNDVENARI